MEWIMRNNGLLGRNTKLSERYGESGTATHVILSVEEYDALRSEVASLHDDITEAKNQTKSVKSEYARLTKKLEKETEERIRIIESDAEERIKVANREKDYQVQLNRNLLRINKERSNLQRNLSPSKKHSGYVVLQSRQVEIRFRKRNKVGTDYVWETTIQTPYSIDFTLEQVDKQIADDLFTDEWKISEIGIVSYEINDYVKLLTEKDEYGVSGEERLKIENTVFKKLYKRNVRSGFWEVVYMHSLPLKAIPADMR